METSKEHFKIFCDAMDFWLEKFQLTKSWRIYYKHKKLDDILAESDIEYDHHIAVFTLTTDWEEKNEKLNTENIQDTAKHEAMHLLIGRLSWYGQARYLLENDISVAEEKLVNTLMNLIK